jgi:transposase
MNQVDIIAIDLAKNVFQPHGATRTGDVVFRLKLTRARLVDYVASIPPCTVAMEACAGAHHWGRKFQKLGHEVKLIAPIYVKPFVKRHKNDVADAEAIAEAALRPTMRYVAVKSADKQASGMAFKIRDLLVRQRTQTINALRGHLTEYGVITANGTQNLPRLRSILESGESGLPEPVRELSELMLAHIAHLSDPIQLLDKELRQRARKDDVASRLMTIPGIGPICATAIEALAPETPTFRKGRDFAAWIGLVPLQNSSGGKEKLGRISKMGQRDLRRLLIIGASSVVRWAIARGAADGSWLKQMLERKPRQVVIVALANRIARVAWALITNGGTYRIGASAVS